jgi:hypothetical protein
VVILDRDMQLAEKVIERFPGNTKGRAVRVYANVLEIDALRHVGDLNLLGAILPCQVFGRDMAVPMAQEYSPKIRVNAVAPGFFLTEQNRFLLTGKEGAD